MESQQLQQHQDIEHLQHIGVKVFAKDAAGFDLETMIPLFHRWIQQRVLEDVSPIDVADYSHMHHGPGVVLVCHEGHFAMDEGDGRLGLLYSNKRLATGTTQDRFTTAIGRALRAASRIEAEPEAAGQLTFATDELLLLVGDRLVAENTPDTLAALGPEIEAVLARLYEPGTATIEHLEDPKASFAVRVKAPEAGGAKALLERLGV